MDPRAAVAAATLQPLFERSVVQILGQRKRGRQFFLMFLGSGFIIHRKENGNRILVMTCRHVVEAIKPGQKLVVRLSGTTLDVPAFKHKYDNTADIQVISVRVPPQRLPVAQLPPVIFSSLPAPVGSIVALIGYYNPINFPLYLGLAANEPLFATAPSAYGGCIVGPQDVTDDSGTIIQHNCYGIVGTSGGPLIHFNTQGAIDFDTQRAIGVFTSLSETIGEAVSTQNVKEVLGTWLEENKKDIDDNDTIEQRIERCAVLY